MARRVVVALAGSLVLAGLSWSTGRAEPRPPEPDDGPAVYSGVLDAAGLSELLASGVDRHELEVTTSDAAAGTFEVEAILSAAQAEQLAARGATLEQRDSAAARRTAAQADLVFRPYSGPGGLQEELAAQAGAYPSIAKLEVIGQTIQGKDINAVRVTRNVARTTPGRRPTTVYVAAQHAREWITPEMVRRLLDYILAGYGTNAEITQLVNTNELWFVPVANPDGYDFSFTPGRRLWRKNTRDNNGDGRVTGVDGVDLNRNYPTRWGYDNEGSSPNSTSDTYRGTAPGSEPETQALDALFARITPEFLINYHSAAELLLHGIGWQVATPSPDDVLYQAMVGDDADPAVPGYDPDISAELYTTNGDTDSHMQEAHGALGFTPEMATCEAASNSVPDDEWEADDCDSGFNFPDDEDLIQAEFEKNVPFALAVAKSAKDPDDPVSVVGIDTPNFVVDSFDVSYGDPQTVAVTAKRQLFLPLMNYKINGGRTQRRFAREWAGGERYGFENIDYYTELRAEVRGADAGDEVQVWFTGISLDFDEFGLVQSDRFTYTVASDTDSTVLIIANEDYTGVNPTYPDPPGGPPKYVDEHVAALQANGITPDVWDVDAQGTPHDLGILSHYAAVVWYLGDNRLTQDPEDFLTDLIGQGEFEDASVAERQQYLTIAVRDFLNEGGKLVLAGETAGYYGFIGALLGGIYYGLDGAPEEDCVIPPGGDLFGDCLLLADDFTQYYLGAYTRVALTAGGVTGVDGGPFEGAAALFVDPATADNSVDEAGAFTVTSDVLPPDQFPQFASAPAAEYLSPEGPFFAVEGDWAVGSLHADDSYMRLGRTYDLTGIAASDEPTFEMQISYDTEEGYDHVIVEARTVGQENWTTLPDLNGATSSDLPAECEAEFLVEEHPNLAKYLTVADPCTTPGSSDPGLWNSFTESSDGWVPAAFDLSAYEGQQVEIVVSYVTDPFTGGTGVIIDDTRLTTTAGASEAEGFETGLGAWSILGAPEGSPGNVVDFERTVGLGGITAAVTTPDSVMLGFGLEQLESTEARDAIVGAVLGYLAGS